MSARTAQRAGHVCVGKERGQEIHSSFRKSRNRSLNSSSSLEMYVWFLVRSSVTVSNSFSMAYSACLS